MNAFLGNSVFLVQDLTTDFSPVVLAPLNLPSVHQHVLREALSFPYKEVFMGGVSAEDFSFSFAALNLQMPFSVSRNEDFFFK